METSYKAIMKLLDYPSADTRRAAVSSVTMLCRAIWILPGRMYSYDTILFGSYSMHSVLFGSWHCLLHGTKTENERKETFKKHKLMNLRKSRIGCGVCER